MVNLLMAYRQIITEMDRLLVQASRTAERLGISDSPDQLPSPPSVPPPPAAATPTRAATATTERRPPSSRPPRDVASPGTEDAVLPPLRRHADNDGPHPTRATDDRHQRPQTTIGRTFAGPGGGGGVPTTAVPWEAPADGHISPPRGSGNMTWQHETSALTASTPSSPSQRGVIDAAGQSPTAPQEHSSPRFRSTTGFLGATFGSGWSPVRGMTASGRRAAQSTPASRPSTTSRSPAAAINRPSASGRFPSTPSRATLRPTIPGTRAVTANRNDGGHTALPLEDLPLTQAEALQLRTGSASGPRTSSDWRSAFSVGEFASSFSMSETPSSSRRASARPGSTRRPRQALFSQAARFTFPGRRSSGD